MNKLQTTGVGRRRDERELRSQATRERILGAALRLFAERGFEATGIRSIASEAGVTTAALYHYASTKDDLLVELMERGISRLVRGARETTSGLGTPEQKLAALVRMHVVSHGTHRMLHVVDDTEFRTLRGEHREVIGGKRDEYEAIWREVISEGISTGVFGIDDPKLSGFALLQMCTGVAHWYSPEGPLSIGEVADRFADMALSLVGAQRDGKILRGADLDLPDASRVLDDEPVEALALITPQERVGEEHAS